METNKITDFQTLVQVMKENAILSALAVLALSGDKKDDITQNEAFIKYGEGWIEDRLQRGYIHRVRQSGGKTSPWIYSVFEIECLKRAEKVIQEEAKRLANEHKNINRFNR